MNFPTDEQPATTPLPENTPIEQQEAEQAESPPQEITLLREQNEKLLNQLQRAVADYQNQKKQFETEKTEFIKYATMGLVLGLLSVVDDFERAFTNTPPQIANTEWHQGIVMVKQHLLKELEKEGVERMEVLEKPFDPHFHEALLHNISDTIPVDHIIQEARAGYLIGDKVIRHAQVIVSKGSE